MHTKMEWEALTKTKLNICLIAMLLLGITGIGAWSEPTLPYKTVIFAVSPEKDSNFRMDPVVFINENYVEPQSWYDEHHYNLITGKVYIDNNWPQILQSFNQNYHWLLGGSKIGELLIKEWGGDDGCGQGGWSATGISIGDPQLHEGLMTNDNYGESEIFEGLATNANSLETKIALRQKINPSEKENALKAAKKVFIKHGISPLSASTLKIENLTKIVSPDKNHETFLIGTFFIKPPMKKKQFSDHYDAISFLIFKISFDGKILPEFTNFNIWQSHFYMPGRVENLVDALYNLDGDGKLSIITHIQYYEAENYVIYKFIAPSQWKKIYRGGGWGC